jgi:hypothetical protein
MIGILISGGTDFVHAQASTSGGCKEYARCPRAEGHAWNSSTCPHYAADVAVPSECFPSNFSANPTDCLSQCNGTGMEKQLCSGEQVVGIGSLMASLVSIGLPKPVGFGTIPSVTCCDSDLSCWDGDDIWCCTTAQPWCSNNVNATTRCPTTRPLVCPAKFHLVVATPMSKLSGAANALASTPALLLVAIVLARELWGIVS